jgi:hypothetical protein
VKEEGSGDVRLVLRECGWWEVRVDGVTTMKCLVIYQDRLPLLHLLHTNLADLAKASSEKWRETQKLWWGFTPNLRVVGMGMQCDILYIGENRHRIVTRRRMMTRLMFGAHSVPSNAVYLNLKRLEPRLSNDV